MARLPDTADLQEIIPATVRNSGECLAFGTAFGATAVSQCQDLQGQAANTIIYYLFPSRAALATGFSQALTKFNFHRGGECTTNGDFTYFIVNCQSDFTSKKEDLTGSVAEYRPRAATAITSRSSSAPTTSRTSWLSWSGPTTATC